MDGSYIYMICASLRPFPTEYWLSDVPSISLWALETGMNVMSSFGRLCCHPLLWFKATPQWKWVQDRLWELRCDWQSADWDTRWIGIGPSGSLWMGGLLMIDCGEIVLRWPKIQQHLSESLYHNDDRMSLYWVQPCLWHSCCALKKIYKCIAVKLKFPGIRNNKKACSKDCREVSWPFKLSKKNFFFVFDF